MLTLVILPADHALMKKKLAALLVIPVQLQVLVLVDRVNVFAALVMFLKMEFVSQVVLQDLMVSIWIIVFPLLIVVFGILLMVYALHALVVT